MKEREYTNGFDLEFYVSECQRCGQPRTGYECKVCGTKEDESIVECHSCGRKVPYTDTSRRTIRREVAGKKHVRVCHSCSEGTRTRIGVVG